MLAEASKLLSAPLGSSRLPWIMPKVFNAMAAVRVGPSGANPSSTARMRSRASCLSPKWSLNSATDSPTQPSSSRPVASGSE